MLPTVVKLWAASTPEYPNPPGSAPSVEELHALDYISAGSACYG
jgi:hypothetical protein